MSNDEQYGRLILTCDNLMKNPKLSLYEEVEIIRAKALRCEADPGILKELSSDISFLIERLSSREKQTYVSCCEDGKESTL